MGLCASKASIIPSRKAGEASPFYWACRNGDIATVEKMLPNLTFEQVNRIEANGSTALHAASFYDQAHIVKLLLASGCSRTIVNYHGKTAYQEATKDEIRALFSRPTKERFVDEHATHSFKLLQQSGVEVEKKDGIPDDWLKGHTSANSAHEAKFMLAMAHSTNPLVQIVKSQTEAESTSNISKLIANVVPRRHEAYASISDLHNKFLNRLGIGNLLTMYTLETPLYASLQNDADSFAVLVYCHLNELRDRAFQGVAYRGARMTEDDIKAYKWAKGRTGYVLETRVIQSMSLNKSVAEEFAKLRPQNQDASRSSVFLTIEFPEKCPTALDLNKISETLPALSGYEKEEEILLLPFTLFSVKEITIDAQTGQCSITLTNMPTPKASLNDVRDDLV